MRRERRPNRTIWSESDAQTYDKSWGGGVKLSPKTLLFAALALLAVIAGSAAWAATHSVETDVRIAVQRLNDGRVEFALQQRIGGEWSDRIQPSGRYLPVNAPTNRWLRSTPVTLAVAVPESAGGSANGQLDSIQPSTHRADGEGTS